MTSLMILSLIVFAGCGYISFSLENRRQRIDFERRNSYGTREYNSWKDARRDQVDEGASSILTVLFAFISGISGLFFLLLLLTASRF